MDVKGRRKRERRGKGQFWRSRRGLDPPGLSREWVEWRKVIEEWETSKVGRNVYPVMIPRRCLGEHSAWYRGARRERLPTPKPVTKLPIDSASVGVKKQKQE
jgi:hypothetical protein